jgi:hypothetical protein
MTQFDFRDEGGKTTTPERWLATWAAKYPRKDDEEHNDLMARHESLCSKDFERIGKWKDSVTKESKWKRNIASVAYEIWMQAASELPQCPIDGRIQEFLTEWSERKYIDKYKNGKQRERHFGPPRAATLLYFVSGGRFPIVDSRVRRAIKRLLNGPEPPNTVKWYVDAYCSLFIEIGILCNATVKRDIDKALFAYGKRGHAIKSCA